jgi:hypothetical protein
MAALRAKIMHNTTFKNKVQSGLEWIWFTPIKKPMIANGNAKTV